MSILFLRKYRVYATEVPNLIYIYSWLKSVGNVLVSSCGRISDVLLHCADHSSILKTRDVAVYSQIILYSRLLDDKTV